MNPHSCKTYLLGVRGSEDVALVDPVLEHFQDYIKLLGERGLKLKHVVDTHTHADHISGASALKDVTGCRYLMHEKTPSVCVDTRINDRDKIKLAGVPAEVLHTPGHTEDAVCLVFSDRILTGDTLFLDNGGAGRDDLPGGNPGKHWESLRKLMQLPEKLIVYPAHDYRNRTPSSLGVQKKTNPHLKPRSKEEFIEYIEDLKLGPTAWMKAVLKANYACAQDPKAAWVPVDAPVCEVKGTLEQGVNAIVADKIQAVELKKLLNSGDPPLLLDVREAKELEGKLGHLENVINIPIGSLAGRLSEFEGKEEQEIVTICHSGMRANTAAQILIRAGFKKVKVLKGGMLAWKETAA